MIVHNSTNLPTANLPTATKNAANLNSFLINERTAMMNGFEEETCNCKWVFVLLWNPAIFFVLLLSPARVALSEKRHTRCHSAKCVERKLVLNDRKRWTVVVSKNSISGIEKESGFYPERGWLWRVRLSLQIDVHLQLVQLTFSNIARIANAVQVTICLLVSTSVY